VTVKEKLRELLRVARFNGETPDATADRVLELFGYDPATGKKKRATRAKT
jgi:hypothetical protein